MVKPVSTCRAVGEPTCALEMAPETAPDPDASSMSTGITPDDLVPCTVA